MKLMKMDMNKLLNVYWKYGMPYMRNQLIISH